MKKIKEGFYKGTEYEKFKNMTTSKKLDYLFGFCTELAGMLLGLIIILALNPNNVKAETNGTYVEVRANECYELYRTSRQVSSLSSTVDVRIVGFSYNGGKFGYAISLEQGMHSVTGSPSGTCSTPYENLTKYTLNNVDYYYIGYSIGADLDPTFPLIDDVSSIQNAIYYTYGEGARDNAGYYKISANYCFNFGVNNNQERSITGNNEIRSVSFYTGSQYRTYFVRPYDADLKYIYNTNSVSCGGEGSAASISRITYNGVQYSLFYSTYTGPPHFTFYRVTAFDNNQAIELTYGETAQYLMSLPEEIDYSRVREIYPKKLVREVANFVQATKGQFYKSSADKKTVSLYVTRYQKDIDAIYSYYLTFDEQTVKNTYTLTSNGFDLTFNELSNTRGGTTAIFDHNLFSGFSPTEYLSNPEALNKDNYGTTYSKIYPDPSKAFVLNSIFDNAYRGIYGYKAFNFPQTIHFIEQERTDFENPYFPGENVKFYLAVNETEEYYDYYVLLGLNLGPNSNMSSIYNYKGGTGENKDGTLHTTHDFYYAMSFLNLDNVGLRSLFLDDPENYEVGTEIDPELTLELKDQGALGVSETEEQDELRGKTVVGEEFSRNLTEYLQTEHNDIQGTMDTWSQNYQVVHNGLSTIVNNKFTSSVQGVSAQVDYVYFNTDIKYFIDAALIFGLAMGVIL